MTLLIFYVALALGVSFLCSILEAVLLSVTPPYVALLREQRPRVGQLLEEFKTDVDRPLAAILSLNTIAHTFGAAGAGAQAVRVFGETWIGVISTVLTLLILVLSERSSRRRSARPTGAPSLLRWRTPCGFWSR